MNINATIELLEELHGIYTIIKYHLPIMGKCCKWVKTRYDMLMSTKQLPEEVKLDERNRLTIKKPESKRYTVTYFDDGSIKLEPAVLISKKTLAEMDEAMEALQRGEGIPLKKTKLKNLRSLLKEKSE